MFPYLPILKKAYELAGKHLWLWVCGLFIIGTGVVNFSAPFISRLSGKQARLTAAAPEITAWAQAHSAEIPLILTLALLLIFAFLILSSWARATVIVSVARETKTPPGAVSILPTLKHSAKFVWRVVGLQFAITAVFLILLLMFALPVVNLFAQNADLQGSILTLLGIAIFLPATLIFGFLHLYGPIVIVLYDRRIGEALNLSFQLIARRLREGIILAAFLIGLEFFFTIFIVFGLLLLALPVVLLTSIFVSSGLMKLAIFVNVPTFVIAGICVIVLKAGFAVFSNITWTLAVQEMIRTRKILEDASDLVADPI